MDLGGFMQGMGDAPGGSPMPGQGQQGGGGVQGNVMPNAQNVTGSPRTYDPLAIFYERLIAGLKALANMAGKSGDSQAQAELEKMAVQLRQQMNARVKAFLAKSKADQAVKQLAGAGAGSSNQGVSY